MNSWYDDCEEMDYTVIHVFKKEIEEKNKKTVNNYINFVCKLPMEFYPEKKRASIIIQALEEIN